MSDQNLSQHPLAQPAVSPNGAKPKKKAVEKAAPQSDQKPEAPESDESGTEQPGFPNPTKPISLKMVRTATLALDQNDASKALVVGRYMANGGGIDGVVSALTRYPDGLVVATVTKQRREGDGITSTNKYILIQGDLECEVL